MQEAEVTSILCNELCGNNKGMASGVYGWMSGGFIHGAKHRGVWLFLCVTSIAARPLAGRWEGDTIVQVRGACVLNQPPFTSKDGIRFWPLCTPAQRKTDSDLLGVQRIVGSGE